jgi:Protein of unknown function (DUF2934)
MTNDVRPASGRTAQTGEKEPRLRRIARRAHELYESRGGTHGNDLQDWLRAEREIDAEIERETEKP